MIVLRLLADADIPVIKSWPHYPPEFAGLDYSLRDGGWLDTHRNEPGTVVFAATENGKLVGFSLLVQGLEGVSEFMVALHPERIGGGLGRTIVRLTLARGFSCPGTARIRLIVRKNNFRAQALYTSLHFVRTGELVKEIQGDPVAFFEMEITREDFTKGEGIMKQVLLVIDVQNEYFSGALPVTYPEGSLGNILKAMDHAHSARMPVVVIRHTNPAPGAPAFGQGSPGADLHPEIKKRQADLVIEKHYPGSFTGTELSAWLKENRITTVTIAGYMTQMCCDTTARQAFHEGYAVNFLSDATGTLSITNTAGSVSAAELHRAILVTQQMVFSRVLSTAEWIAET